MTLQPAHVRAFYDRFGKKQDAQGFYEDAALDDLTAHAFFDEAQRVFELGCGTGRYAAGLLSAHLPAEATYLGADLSRTMFELATERLEPYAERARVVHSEGAVGIPLPDASVDRVLSTYVLDLLSEDDIDAFLREAHRVLETDGRLCLVGLTEGTTVLSRVVAASWKAAFRVRPTWVGGCRPISLGKHVETRLWDEEYRKVVVSFGVPSEVLVARARRSEG